MTALATAAMDVRPAHGGLAATGPVEALRDSREVLRERASVTGLAPYREAAAARDAQPAKPALSSREVEVLLAWLISESKEEAAARLYISASTVSTHISRIRAKYSAIGRTAPTKTHLLARALQDGYTCLSDW
ncbi:MAG: LuxR C-terminal-related transcriptional regulator [Gordonia sp. (in: high G+C Gram-positive bacteria)]